MKRRIGPVMRIVVDYVVANPGCSILEVDRNRRTARGGHQWIYRATHRAIRAGLIRAERRPGRYALFATEVAS